MRRNILQLQGSAQTAKVVALFARCSFQWLRLPSHPCATAFRHLLACRTRTSSSISARRSRVLRSPTTLLLNRFVMRSPAALRPSIATRTRNLHLHLKLQISSVVLLKRALTGSRDAHAATTSSRRFASAVNQTVNARHSSEGRLTAFGPPRSPQPWSGPPGVALRDFEAYWLNLAAVPRSTMMCW